MKNSPILDAVLYRNGQKNNWRRSAWNAIDDLVRGPKRDKIVLYLPGSTDLDRPEALRRGYKDANLIAVERDPAVAKVLRAKGVTTIIGDLLTVMQSWPGNLPVGVVIADFQSGLDAYTGRVVREYLSHPAFDGGVLLTNSQRGRDNVDAFVSEMRAPKSENWAKASLALRAVREREEGISWTQREQLDKAQANGRSIEASRNRIVSVCATEYCRRADGAFAAAVVAHNNAAGDRYFNAYLAAEDLWFHTPHSDPRKAARRKEYKRLSAESFRQYALDKDLCHYWVNVNLLAPYRSSERGVLMDGCVLQYESLMPRTNPTPGPLARHVAAALAIRTRRLRGEL